MLKLAILLNVLMMIFAAIGIGQHGLPDVGDKDFFIVLLLIFTPAINLIAFHKQGFIKKDWSIFGLLPDQEEVGLRKQLRKAQLKTKLTAMEKGN